MSGRPRIAVVLAVAASSVVARAWGQEIQLGPPPEPLPRVDEDGCRVDPLTAEDEDRGRSLLAAMGTERVKKSPGETLANALLAYRIFKNDAAALVLIDAARRSRRAHQGVLVGLERIRCGGSMEALRPSMAALQAEASRVSIQVNRGSTEGAFVVVDGEPFPWRDVDGMLWLSPGKHSLCFRSRRGRDTPSVEVETILGQPLSVVLLGVNDPPEDPAPRRSATRQLNPELHEPPKQPSPTRYSDAHLWFSLGAIGPFVAFVPNSEVSAVGGGGVRAGGSVRLANWGYKHTLWVDGELDAALIEGSGERALLAGVAGQAHWHIGERYGLAVGGTLGHLFDVDEKHGTLLESYYFGPIATPVSLRFGLVHLDLRASLLFADRSERGVVALRPALFLPHATLTFGSGLL